MLRPGCLAVEKCRPYLIATNISHWYEWRGSRNNNKKIVYINWYQNACFLREKKNSRSETPVDFFFGKNQRGNQHTQPLAEQNRGQHRQLDISIVLATRIELVNGYLNIDTHTHQLREYQKSFLFTKKGPHHQISSSVPGILLFRRRRRWRSNPQQHSMTRWCSRTWTRFTTS